MKTFGVVSALCLMGAMYALPVQGQEAATITGRVTNAQGQPESAIKIRIGSLGVETVTGSDGRYRLVVPGARIRAGQAVTITASRARVAGVTREDGVNRGNGDKDGYTKSITLKPGAKLTQHFVAPILLRATEASSAVSAMEGPQHPDFMPVDEN